MEAINIAFEDAEFDKLVHEGSLRQASTVTIGVKAEATKNKMPGAVIAFDVETSDGVKRAQATVTLRQLKRALEVISFKYPTL